VEAKDTNILQKDLENTSGLFVDKTRDTLDTTSTSETTDGGLCDTLDVVTEDLAVTLGAALSETLGRSQRPKSKFRCSDRPFHLFHGQTLLCDKCFGRREVRCGLRGASC
jgi:hypothetical protein